MTETKTQSEKEKVKIFEDLNEEIIQTNLCCACGACIAYCESQSFDVIEFDGYTPKFKSEAKEENCKECGLCYFICPQTGTLKNILAEQLKIRDELGNIREILAAKTTEEQIKKVGQDGGVVTTILYFLFKHNKIDAAVISDYDDQLRTIPKIVYNKEDLLHSAGTRYSISSQILPLKDLYHIPEEIKKEKGIYDIEQLRIAFVGTPCQAKAIRKMQFLSIKPAHVVKYIISLFCYENFHYSKLFDIFRQRKGIKPSEIKKTSIKKNFFIKTKDEQTIKINLRDLEPAVREHCKRCDDFTGKYSDISVGSTGAPDGYSLIISRTEIGDSLIMSLLSRKFIERSIHSSDRETDWKEKRKKILRGMISNKKSL